MEPLVVVVIVEIILTFGLSVFGIYSVLSKSHFIARVFCKAILIIMGLNILQAIITAVNWFIFTHYFLTRLGTVLTNLVAIGILFLNTEILQVFSVLNENITKRRIKIFRIVIFVFMFILELPNNLRIFYGKQIPPLINNFLGASSLLLVVLIVFYDNCQALYLTLLVFWNKKAKAKGKLTKETMKAFKRMLFTNIFILVFDWFGIGIYCYLLANYASLASLDTLALAQISELNTSIHPCIMIFVIKELKNFTFSDTKLTPKAKPIRKGDTTKALPSQ